jgi:membrane protease subunit (stomatin/prohibitin family)
MPEAETFMKIVEDHHMNKGYEGEISDFHKLLNSKRDYDTIKKSTNFQIKRLVLNYLYLTIAQIGIKPVEKFSMCYSLARYFEEVLGEDWKIQLEDESRFRSLN